MTRSLAAALCVFVVVTAAAQGQVTKRTLTADQSGPSLLKPDAWGPWQKGFAREGKLFVCDNGDDNELQSGCSQVVVLNQSEPKPILAVAWSRAENVGGTRNSDYSLYLDLVHTDGTPWWGHVSPFSTGAHGWERREVVVLPSKPVRSVSFHMLLRRHTGKAWFRDPALYVVDPPQGSTMFDGAPAVIAAKPGEGFQVCDAAARSDYVTFEDGRGLGLAIETRRTVREGVTFVDAELTDTTGRDRAVTLVYALPVKGPGWQWLADPRTTTDTKAPTEYRALARFTRAGRRHLSRYPFAAVANASAGVALGIDMARPAFFRVGYSPGAEELYVAYDLGLAPERNRARVRLCHFRFDAKWGFRSALARYYEAFPDHFRCRTPEQGLWMPFAKISKVEGWEDFGFKFKEGNNETPWDDEHGMVTFRYTEPHTWWMRMSKDMPRTMEAALALAKEMASKKGDKRARSLFTSGYHDEHGRIPARLRNTPWCDGAVWSMNAMPGVPGEPTDFKNKWNADVRDRYYGPKRKGDLDGEYVDSSEGYVTDELNFRRGHFAGAETPLTYDYASRKPAIFRGLAAYEYVRALERDVRAMGKLMMANSTPSRLCWLAPWLDVMGCETNWNRGGTWMPMSDADLLFRRIMSGPKPYCFLMNTVFEEFPHERVEKYMKRSLAYGMFPGFFSHNASQGHYFTRPELYNRDRPLFKKYVPLCKLVAEAGWQPITLARSSDPKVYVERFGPNHLTVFNDSADPRPVTISLDGMHAETAKDLVAGQPVEVRGNGFAFTLAAEDVAVIELTQ